MRKLNLSLALLLVIFLSSCDNLNFDSFKYDSSDKSICVESHGHSFEESSLGTLQAAGWRIFYKQLVMRPYKNEHNHFEVIGSSCDAYHENIRYTTKEESRETFSLIPCINLFSYNSPLKHTFYIYDQKLHQRVFEWSKSGCNEHNYRKKFYKILAAKMLK